MCDRVEKLNYAAVAQTLEHHCKVIKDLAAQIKVFQNNLVMLQNEFRQQKQLIVKSLQQKYQQGSTND